MERILEAKLFERCLLTGDFHRASTELTVQFSCSFMQPMEAVLLLISSSPYGLHSTTLAFHLKTHVSQITPTVSIIN